jgi:hypothetical protein
MSIARRSLFIASQVFSAVILLLGSSQVFPAKAQTGLTFFPVNPCRIVDTRVAGGILQAGISRTFVVNRGGSTFNYGSQGGTTSGCGLPTTAKAAFFNFTVVTPTAPGFLRAWPFGSSLPNASISNFANLTGLNIANGIAVPVCNPASTTCSTDLNVQVDQGNAQLVVDVVGYFADPTAPLPSSEFVPGTYKYAFSPSQVYTCPLITSAFGDRTEVNIGCVYSPTGSNSLNATWYTGPIVGNPYQTELTTAKLNTIPGNENLAWGKVGDQGSTVLSCFRTGNLFSARQVGNTVEPT